ncbi:citrate synthase [Caulobacter sp. SLTY]|uniref:citrate synthase n=1 Tax=Caulobacter sp. SLTY TaxID=2683262 RepID=UPI00141336F3|nr:citrate synthase [Caulobacter sp. SLTY]NBB13827.1 citrate synthase [Caulobacter sp. SLTY]
MSQDWISREAALQRLGVRPQTLYAYVSRGRVDARPDPDDPRRSLYRAADIGALTDRRARGRKASAVAQSAIAWGEPVLASAITTISDGRLWYRGRDASRLSETETLEAVARLLRGGHGAVLKAMARPDPPTLADGRARLFAALAARAAEEPPARGRAPLALAMEGSALLDVVADAVCGAPGTGPIHDRLAVAWGRPDAADVIRRALVLLADHELNASTFAARVAASTGAGLAAAALAGLCALSGPLHGGMAARVLNLVEESRRIGPRATVEGRLARAAPTPGFGHPLYPEGDPRADALLAACPPTEDLAALLEAVESGTGERANIDFALVAMAEALGLPDDAPFLLFAVARSAGWIAHAVEEGSGGRLIRPRARYVGPAVGG